MSADLLILRPEPGASATAARARETGLVPAIVPLFATRPVVWDAPDPAGFDGVMMTSANAARHGGDALESFHHLPLWAVGEATGEAAGRAGFSDVRAGANDASALLDMIARAGMTHVLHLAGAEYRDATHPAIAIERRIVYEARAVEPAPRLAGRVRAGGVMLVHSPRAGVRLDEVARAQGLDRSGLALAAISPAALTATGGGWRAAEAAARPDDDSLMALAARLCEQDRDKNQGARTNGR